MLEMLRQIWSRVQGELQSRAGATGYEQWLDGLRPLALERGVCYLEARSRFVAERVQRLYQSLIEETLSVEMGTRIGVTVVAAPDSKSPDALEVGPTRPIVDPGNRTAFMILESLVQGNELPGNCYFFWGAAGTGKSYLLRWWAQHTRPKPREFCGPQLVKAFQACLRDGRVAELRAELTEDVPLLLDEIHRISAHRRLQRELLSVLEARRSCRHPVVIASRWHPNDIWKLDPSLGSFLLSGIAAKFDYPGPEARLTFLRALEGAASRNGRAQDIEEMARDIRGGYPELRHAWMVRREGYAHRSHYLRLIDPRTTFDKLVRKVCVQFESTSQELLSKSQTRRISYIRQVLCYLCVQEGLSRAEVGRFLGGRSRAAVSYSTKRVEQLMAESADVRSQVEALL